MKQSSSYVIKKLLFNTDREKNDEKINENCD